MDHRDKKHGMNIALFFTFLVFDPVGFALPQSTARAAQFAPAIVITRGKTEQGFHYLSGGVGADERIALEERAKAFNVKLVFAETDGSFVADVKLEIVGVKNEVILSTTATGPWFYIQLPPGIYNVKATFAGQSKEVKTLRVTKDKSTHQVFVWDLVDAPKTAPRPKA
jgi:hypothetical protein